MNGSPEFWLRPGDELADDAIRSIPGEDFTDPVIDTCREAVGGNRHVAEDEAVGEGRRAHRKLGEGVVEAASVCFEDSAGVVSNEVHHLIVNAERPEVPGPV